MIDPALDLFARLQDAVAGSWSVERQLGQGGMATVWLARDVALDRPVAIKLLDPSLAAEPESRERFLHEARTGARLAHPHIVPIYDVVEHGDLVFFVMGLVDGESLGARIRREGPLSPGDATRILREVGWALAAAHAAGVLHRDVTVDNILLERRTGRALLADFGIAAPRDAGTDAALVGTPAYLAPELIHGAPPSPASDLYALGITGWTMLAGRLPFLDEEIARLLIRQVSEPIPALEQAAPGTPRRLVGAIEELLVKEPAERPGSVEGWLAGLESSAPTPRLATPLEHWVELRAGLRPMYALAITSIGMLGAAGGVLALADQTNIIVYAAKLFLGVSAVVAIVQASMALRAIRRAGRVGYRIEDLRLALERRLSERQAIGPLPPRTAGRVIGMLGNLAGVSLAAMLVMLISGGSPTVLPFGARIWLWRSMLFLLPIVWAAFWTMRGLGVVIPGRATMPNDRRSRWRRAFWKSRLGSWWFRAINIGTTTQSAASTLHRPTEMVLGLQIADLWRALPAGSRLGLGDLPATADALHRRLDEVRHLLASIDPVAPAADPAIDDLRARLVARRDAALAALEELRILLLQLGAATAPAGELTRKLRDAREVEIGLLEELGAHGDVRRLLGKRLSPSPG